ncbi:hypothetical protein [Galbibacter mesophilus]|uniref:hypothetical protein n=1 Tax=Galbibacter mesophilus TaxID=379069 RepID=UPI00191EC4BC|nr:hypothetical protein [Galbibacter mesophilus]MCM5661791.1 DUF4962 domain-containing protein [Galbibacter mesophilus]
MKNTVYPFLIFLMMTIASCSSDDNDTPARNPAPAILIFPLENSECTEGVVSPTNENESTITFEWNQASDTDSYQLLVTNLNTNNTQTFASNTNSLDVTLTRGAPYEWFVISLANNSQETANSEEWKFYNADDGVESYPPFPADLLEPSSGNTLYSSGSITFEWKGSDIEGDISSYEISIGENNPPSSNIISGITEESYTHSALGAGIYYWQVKTIDENGNSSLSEISQFRVE